jgi:hypothetical protein
MFPDVIAPPGLGYDPVSLNRSPLPVYVHVERHSVLSGNYAIYVIFTANLFIGSNISFATIPVFVGVHGDVLKSYVRMGKILTHSMLSVKSVLRS